MPNLHSKQSPTTGLYLVGLLVLATFVSGCGPLSDADNRPCTVEGAEQLGRYDLSGGGTLDGCYHATEPLDIGGRVDIEPGTTIYVASGARLWVQGVVFNAVGTEEEPITITGEEQVPGYWSRLRFDNTGKTDTVLEHVILEYGGGGGDKTTLKIEGESRPTIRHTTIRHSEGLAFSIGSSKSEIQAFENNTITNNGRAGAIHNSTADVLDPSNEFKDNDKNKIEVFTRGVYNDVTFHDIGIPYEIGTQLEFRGNHVTLEPGVEWHMAADTRIWVQSDSKFTAVGTESKPIVIRGKEQTAGYWKSLYFDASKSTENRLEHFVLEDAGSGDGNHAIGLLSDINHGDSSATVKNGTIRNIDGRGIWVDESARGTSTIECGGVTFEDVSEEHTVPADICQ